MDYITNLNTVVWYPQASTLPTTEGLYIVHFKYDLDKVVYWIGGNWYDAIYTGIQYKEDITHWRHLVKPPRKSK